MKRKTKLKLLALLPLVGTLFALAGCTIGIGSKDDFLAQQNLVAQITYYANGGWFGTTASKENNARDLYYRENDKPLEIHPYTPNVKVNRDDHDYIGWYTIQTTTVESVDYYICALPDDTDTSIYTYQTDGGETVSCVSKVGEDFLVKVTDYEQLVQTENVPTLALAEQFDFTSHRMTKGEKLKLAAKWEAHQKVEFVLLTEDCESINVNLTTGENVTYQNGDVVGYTAFDDTGKAYKLHEGLEPVGGLTTDATFVDYYQENDDGTYSLTFLEPIVRPDDGSNVTVYVKYVYGIWKIINGPEDVKSIFTQTSSKFYLSRSVDMADAQTEEAIYCPTGTFSGTIRGNGFEIVGLNITSRNALNNIKVAIFGQMTAQTKIENVTFRDVTVTLDTRSVADGKYNLVSVYLLARAVSGSTPPTLNGLKIVNATVEITKGTNVVLENIQNDSGWIYAGKSNAEFMQEFEGVTLEQIKLVIDTQTVDEINPATNN